MRRSVVFVYGLLSYGLFFAAFLYLVGFIANLGVPCSIDAGGGGLAGGSLGAALAVNTLLLVLFGVQHSVMARPGFKRWWTRFVPRPIERSTYVLFTTAALVLLFWLWQPLPAVIWNVENAVGRALLYGLFFAGVGTVLYSTVLIDHFDLFGLRQTFLHWREQPYEEKHFVTPSLYRFIRHPLYVGWLVTFWVTPTLTLGHLLFATVWTAYIAIAIPLEERDLAAHLGEDYRRWKTRTPMFVPRPRWRAEPPAQARAADTGSQ